MQFKKVCRNARESWKTFCKKKGIEPTLENILKLVTTDEETINHLSSQIESEILFAKELLESDPDVVNESIKITFESKENILRTYRMAIRRSEKFAKLSDFIPININNKEIYIVKKKGKFSYITGGIYADIEMQNGEKSFAHFRFYFWPMQ